MREVNIDGMAIRARRISENVEFSEQPIERPLHIPHPIEDVVPVRPPVLF